MTYTLGPWQPKLLKMGCFIVEPVDQSQQPICLVDGGAMGEDNARLIAAAPDLLEAVKLALNAFEKNWCIDWNILQEAIDKAEGREVGTGTV